LYWYFFKYDEKNKKIEKIDEIKTNKYIYQSFETKDGNIIIFLDNEIVIYDKNKSIQTGINIIKNIQYMIF